MCLAVNQSPDFISVSSILTVGAKLKVEMNCPKCNSVIRTITCNDDPNKGIAYNVFECIDCMIIIKENVWDHKGTIIINPDNTIETIK